MYLRISLLAQCKYNQVNMKSVNYMIVLTREEYYHVPFPLRLTLPTTKRFLNIFNRHVRACSQVSAAFEITSSVFRVVTQRKSG